MTPRLIIFIAILLTGACANIEENAKKSLTATLLYQQDVSFTDVEQFPGEVVCGKYEVIDKWGNSKGYRSFIVRDGRADHRPGADDIAIFCTNDPAAALSEHFGIGPVTDKLRQVVRDFHVIDPALRQYIVDNFDFPSTEQGLQALVAPGPPQKPLHYRAGGYLKKIPVDPWGRAYLYANERQLHGVPKVYRLYTLGRDGQTGGRGEDADISIRHLPYLDHILSR